MVGCQQSVRDAYAGDKVLVEVESCSCYPYTFFKRETCPCHEHSSDRTLLRDFLMKHFETDHVSYEDAVL